MNRASIAGRIVVANAIYLGFVLSALLGSATKIVASRRRTPPVFGCPRKRVDSKSIPSLR